MADHMSACIYIGGPVKRGLIPGLCEAICAEGVRLDYDEFFNPEREADLLKAVNKNGHIELTDPDARWGKFETVEAFLEANEIAYDRHTCARYEYDGEIIRHRPGLGTWEDMADADGEAALHSDADVREVRQLLKEGQVAAAVEKLDQMCPEIPDLAAVTFVD